MQPLQSVGSLESLVFRKQAEGDKHKPAEPPQRVVYSSDGRKKSVVSGMSLKQRKKLLKRKKQGRRHGQRQGSKVQTGAAA